jgi:anaerobic magnesium-protoporphyrin IX monomethyl ester cyclase
MRIMLANPQSASNLYRQFGGNLPPLGLTYLAAVLRLDGHQVQIADLEVESDRKINFSSFDVIGITAFTPQYNNAVRLAREAKKEGITVVMGGYHVSFQSQEALSTGVVDFVVRGEGENSFRNLINCLESGGGVGEIPGISYLENGRCVRTPPAPLEADLDRMPLPARDLLPLNKYPNELCRRRATSVITSRGCPFNCSFCICSKMGGLK